jgi:hypothetical protein
MVRHVSLAFVLLFVWGQGAFGAEAPRLQFARIIGDARGKCLDNLSVAVTDEGKTYLLMRSGRVAVFGPQDAYLKSEKVALSWPQEHYCLAGQGRRVFLGHYRQDFPWVFSPQRRGQAAGRFESPSCVALDPRGNVYVADAGNRRVQVFTAVNTETPEQVVPLPARPIAVSARDNLLAVLTDEQSLSVFEQVGGQFSLRTSLKVGRGGRAVAIGPNEDLLVAFEQSLKRYELKGGVLKKKGVVSPALTDDWPGFFPAGVPMTLGPDGEIWFAADTQGAILSLNPNTDQVRIRLRGVYRPLTVGFDKGNKIYVGGSALPKAQGPCLSVFPEGEPQPKAEPFPLSGLLYQETGVPVWGLLCAGGASASGGPDSDGGVYVRVVEQGYLKGWPALTFKKVYPDGAMKPFLDFGPLYAVRATFHPTAAAYSLQGDGEGNILLAAIPLRAVLKVTAAGKILWEAGLQPQGGADRVEFTAPRDTAIDRHGNIWVVDGGANKIYCLSPAGKLLMVYGGYAGVDDTEGKGFDGPTGIEVTTVGDVDYVYVGDAGNQRIVKFRVE